MFLQTCTQDGETWCINFFNGGIWKQTSYNNNFRKMYAGIGMIYDPVKDKFLSTTTPCFMVIRFK